MRARTDAEAPDLLGGDTPIVGDDEFLAFRAAGHAHSNSVEPDARRLAMLGSDLVRGAAVAVITALVATGTIRLAALVVMALVFGLADAVFFPASTAITAELVPAELLVGTSALGGTSTQLAQILIGAAVGGFIAGLVGTAWGFGIDAPPLSLARSSPR
ncbi:MAG: MFS transporter [Acidimicrobiales bacterium]